MDYEIKILLNNLIDAVNNTNHTDWWMFGVTIINVIITGFFAYQLWHTTKQLGEEQNKINKYVVNKELYIIIYKVWRFSHTFVYKVERILEDIIDNSDIDEVSFTINELRRQIYFIKKDLNKNKIIVLAKSFKVEIRDIDLLLMYAGLITNILNGVIRKEHLEATLLEFRKNDCVDIDYHDKRCIKNIEQLIKENDIDTGDLLFDLEMFAVIKNGIFEKKQILKILE